MHRVAELERAVEQLRAGRSLEAATIGKGGITIIGEGGITLQGGSVRVLDDNGDERILMGLLSDSSYGLEAVDDDGRRVKLDTLAFGLTAAGDDTVGTRTGTLPNTYVWGDLAGSSVGPSVTVDIGTSGKALVFWSFEFVMTGPFGNGIAAFCSPEVSGANTVAADETWAAGDSSNPMPAEAHRTALGRHKLFTGLSPGSTTFTLKYAVFGITGGTPTVSFEEREIAVLPY